MEKVFITRVLPGLLALVMVASIQVANLTGAQLREIHSAIDITIDRRGNPTDPPLFVGGIVTLHIDPKEGSFTGTITPGFGFTPGSLPGTQGVPLTSVLFRFINGSLVPDPSVTQIAVDGQINGRAVNIVLRDVLGAGNHIYALGTTEFDPGPKFEKDYGRLAGPAVGPLPGDVGFWDPKPCGVFAFGGRAIMHICGTRIL